MSWLEELNEDVVYNYEFIQEKESSISGTIRQFKRELNIDIKGEPGEVIEVDGNLAKYAGFEPIKLKQEARIEYEKNGRKAVHIIDKKGNHKYISKTKLQFMKTGCANGVYSKGYEEHLRKTQQEHLLVEDRKHRFFSAALLKNSELEEKAK